MRIYVIGARSFPNTQGGIEKHCEELYSRLAKSDNMNITVLTTVKNFNQPWKGINFVNIPTIKKKSLEKVIYGLLASIYSIVKRPDIVHIQGLNTSLYIPLLKLFGLKVVYTQHSLDYLYPKWNVFAKKILLLSEYCSTFSDHITVVSPIIKKRFKEKYNKESTVIYNGVYFHSNYTTDKPISLDFDIVGEKYILFVGRITPEKDIITLIAAFDKIKDKDLYLLIIGESDHNDRYTKLITEQARKNKKIVLAGSIENRSLPCVYKNSELFILPSRFESFGIVVLEAIYNLTEILLSNIESLKLFGLEEEYYFEPGDILDLVRKIDYLTDKPSPIAYRVELKEKVKKLYNWETSANIIRKIYKDLYIPPKRGQSG